MGWFSSADLQVLSPVAALTLRLSISETKLIAFTNDLYGFFQYPSTSRVPCLDTNMFLFFCHFSRLVCTRAQFSRKNERRRVRAAKRLGTE